MSDGIGGRPDTNERMGPHHGHSLTMKQPIHLSKNVNITRLTQTLTNKDQKESKEDASQKKNFRHIRSQMLKPEDLRKADEVNAVALFFDEDLVQARNEK
jgi:hypothetical protein